MLELLRCFEWPVHFPVKHNPAHSQSVKLRSGAQAGEAGASGSSSARRGAAAPPWVQPLPRLRPPTPVPGPGRNLGLRLINRLMQFDLEFKGFLLKKNSFRFPGRERGAAWAAPSLSSARPAPGAEAAVRARSLLPRPVHTSRGAAGGGLPRPFQKPDGSNLSKQSQIRQDTSISRCFLGDLLEDIRTQGEYTSSPETPSFAHRMNQRLRRKTILPLLY